MIYYSRILAIIFASIAFAHLFRLIKYFQPDTLKDIGLLLTNSLGFIIATLLFFGVWKGISVSFLKSKHIKNHDRHYIKRPTGK